MFSIISLTSPKLKKIYSKSTFLWIRLDNLNHVQVNLCSWKWTIHLYMIQVVELDSKKSRCEIDLLAFPWHQTYYSEHDKLFLCNTPWKYYSSNSASIHFCKWSSSNYHHKIKNILTYRFTWYWNAFSYSILFFEWKR